MGIKYFIKFKKVNTMSDKERNKQEDSSKSKTRDYKPPKGQKKKWSLRVDGRSINCFVVADWMLIRKKEKPIADIFYTYYSSDLDKANRPITFVFNGGPGASSAYLHVGAIGPKTVCFGKKGECLPPPAQLKDNIDSWFGFTDLVFVDPVGTGFSRSLEEVDLGLTGEKEKRESKAKDSHKEFYKINRDLESIGEFIQQFLSKYRRWSSPVFIAGESYGGFRVAKLSRKLQEEYGVGLRGVILISPCLELNSLSSNDYDILHWVESFPTMAASAAWHEKSSCLGSLEIDKSIRVALEQAEDFAVNELSCFLVQGERMPVEKRKAIIQKIVDFIAVPFEKISKSNGRLHLIQFCRLLLQRERKWCGMYDTSVTTYDPFPGRDQFEGSDPTLSSVEHIFTHGINILLREHLELSCERQYRLLNIEVNESWKHDKQKHFFDLQIGATDDLRYAMAMNPEMKVFICHGIFDLVTPYFSSERVIHLMNLPEELKKQMDFQVFHGGHMFYTWEHSRKSFRSQMQKFYK